MTGFLTAFFNFQHTTVFARCHDKQTWEHLLVTEEEFTRVQANIQRQFAEVAQSLCDEMDRRFPEQDLLDAFGVIYPQYWKQEGVEDSFPVHLQVLKSFYCKGRVLAGAQPYTAMEMLSPAQPNNQQSLFKITMKVNSAAAMEMLSPAQPDNQQSLFKISMKVNSAAACSEPPDVNFVIKLWMQLLQSR